MTQLIRLLLLSFSFCHGFSCTKPVATVNSRTNNLSGSNSLNSASKSNPYQSSGSQSSGSQSSGSQSSGSQSSGSQSDTSSNVGDTTISDNTTPQAPLPPKKIDASRLRVVNVSISDYRGDDGLLGQSLYTEVMGGSYSYIFVIICPLDPPLVLPTDPVQTDPAAELCPKGTDPTLCAAGGVCVKQMTSFNRTRLPPLYAGNVEIRLQACVSPDLAATNETCGPVDIEQYTSKRANEDYMRIERKIGDAKNNIKIIVAEQHAALKSWSDGVKKCNLENIKYENFVKEKLDFIDTYISMPANEAANVITAGIDSNAVTGGIAGTVHDSLSSIGHSLNGLCKNDPSKNWTKKMDTSGVTEEGSPMVCDLVKGLPTMFNPATSLATFSSAIFDLMDPEHSAPLECHDEEKLSHLITGYKIDLETQVNDLTNYVNQAKALNQ